MLKPIISADSHMTEPPGTYVDREEEKNFILHDNVAELYNLQ